MSFKFNNLQSKRSLLTRILKEFYTWTHRNGGQSRHFRHENFEKFDMFSTPTGSWIRSRLRRDRIQLPVGVENMSNFSKFSCRKWRDCPNPSKWRTVLSLLTWKFWKIRDVFDLDGQLESIAPRRDRFQLPVEVENISNFPKFSCQKWQDCPSFRWVQVGRWSNHLRFNEFVAAAPPY